MIALASCQSVDTNVSAVSTKVQKYCIDLEAASDTAALLSNDKLVTKISAAVETYCRAPINDVPSAIAVLAQTYLAVKHAGIEP